MNMQNTSIVADTFKPLDLSERAMIVSLKICQFTGSKCDKRVTAEAVQRESASSDAGRFNKRLLDKEATAAISAAVGELRKYHYAQTLPWLDDGQRVLMSTKYVEYAQQMAKHKAAFDIAVNDFVDNYSRAVESAKSRLGGMFNEGDYPHIDDIRACYGVFTRNMPLPDKRDFRAGVPEDVAESIRAEIEASNAMAIETAQRDIYERVAVTLSNMTDKLSSYDPKKKGDKGRIAGCFRDSLVENVRELADLIPNLNITDSPHIARLADQLATLSDVSPKDLRTDSKTRATVNQEATRILSNVRTFLT